ncbi:MAG: nitroreductase family protein [Cumulibacter sp.]
MSTAPSSEAAYADALIRQASIRRFDPTRAVTSADLETIVDAARWTGSARNRQPWQVIAVRSVQMRAALSRLGRYAQYIAEAPVVLVVLSEDNKAADTEFDVGRFTQSLTLAAAARGLRSCVATIFPERNSRAAAELVGSGEGWIVKHVLALGYRATPAAEEGQSAVPRGRRPLGEIFREL